MVISNTLRDQLDDITCPSLTDSQLGTVIQNVERVAALALPRTGGALVGMVTDFFYRPAVVNVPMDSGAIPATAAGKIVTIEGPVTLFSPTQHDVIVLVNPTGDACSVTVASPAVESIGASTTIAIPPLSSRTLFAALDALFIEL